MLSRLMTRREQLLLLGVGVAICVGAGALYLRGRMAAREESQRQLAKVAPIEEFKAISLEPAIPPAPPVPEVKEPLVFLPPPPEPERLLAVSVSGAVNQPGMYRLKDDARVQDLLDAANGVREEADLSDINLAARLMDGTTLTIPSRGTALRDGKKLVLRSGESATDLNPPLYTISGWRAEAGKPAESAADVAAQPHAASPAAATPSGPIDLNTATQEMLESLPGVGPKTAEKIIAYRAHTPFQTVDDLKNVSGIGDKKLEAVRSLVTVHSASPEPSIPADGSRAPSRPSNAKQKKR